MKKAEKDKRPPEYWMCPSTNHVLEAALYYGFSIDNSFSISKNDKDLAKGMTTEFGSHSVSPEEKIAILRTFLNNQNMQLPIMFAHAASSEQAEKDSKHSHFSFDIIGASKSIADATIIKLFYELCLENYEEPLVEINTIGDRDSSSRYIRELTNYFRKNISELHPDCRQQFKKGALAIVSCEHEKCREIKNTAPHSINYLSEPSRSHFKELLEFLEMSEVPYTLNHNLIENNEYIAHTIFRITAREKGQKDSTTVAWGARWSNLAKKMGFKKDMAGVSGEIVIQKISKQDQKQLKKIKKPRFYFIQVGQEAKLKSLQVIEILRKAKIPLYHSLTKDKLTAQLSWAEQIKVPHILIMGQKESMEHAVLVRNTIDRSQNSVRIHEVANHIKKLLS